MIRIAICDDEKNIRTYLSYRLLTMNEEYWRRKKKK